MKALCGGGDVVPIIHMTLPLPVECKEEPRNRNYLLTSHSCETTVNVACFLTHMFGFCQLQKKAWLCKAIFLIAQYKFRNDT